MSRASEIVRDLEDERDRQAERAEAAEAKGLRLGGGLQDIAAVLTSLGFAATEAPAATPDTDVWRERCEKAERDLSDATNKLDEANTALDVVLNTLGVEAPEPDDYGYMSQLSIRVDERMVEIRREAETNPILGAIERSAEWTIEEVELRLQRDPLWLERLLGQRVSAAERPEEDGPGDDEPPRDTDEEPTRAEIQPALPPIPEDAKRFASSLFEMSEAQIEAAWTNAMGDLGRFRALCSAPVEAVGEDAPARARPPEAPPTESGSRKRTEVAATIPSDWVPDAAQIEHANKNGFSKAQALNLGLAFRAEMLKSGETSSRWGSRFRGYVTDAAKRRDAERKK